MSSEIEEEEEKEDEEDAAAGWRGRRVENGREVPET